MRLGALPLACSLFISIPALGAMPKTPTTTDRQLAWWRDQRFGMFIHWGPVSLKGTEIGWSRGAEVPIAEYDSLYRRFNPTKFNADAWARLAKAAGMRYVVLTTKHHDGFCLWDTKLTDYNVMNSPFGRDVVKELSAACRHYGLAFGTYYSVCDWRHPDFPFGSPGGTTKKPSPNLDLYTEYLRGQVMEIIRNYGPLSVMWFDVPQGFGPDRGKPLVEMVRNLQPGILINDRAYEGGGEPVGDYATPEQTIGGFRMDRPWESCMTIANQWAWKPNDPVKSLDECIDTLVRCAGGDGNLLLNVGPDAEGVIEPEQAARLREVGAWLKRHGESIYGTRGGPYKPGSGLACTRKGNTIYLHLLRPVASISLPPLPATVRKAALLGGGRVSFQQFPGALTVTLPDGARQQPDTVVKLTLDSPAMAIEPITVPAQPAALPGGVKVSASNVFQDSPDFGPDKALDGDPTTRWATDYGVHSAWLEMAYPAPIAATGFHASEEFDRVKRYRLECWDSGAWRTIVEGTGLGRDHRRTFPAITASRFRLSILEADEGPTLREFSVGASAAIGAKTTPSPSTSS